MSKCPVVPFPGCDLPVEIPLNDAINNDLKSVLILGVADDGLSNYCSSSTADVATLLLMVERFKFKLLNGDFA